MKPVNKKYFLGLLLPMLLLLSACGEQVSVVTTTTASKTTIVPSTTTAPPTTEVTTTPDSSVNTTTERTYKTIPGTPTIELPGPVDSSLLTPSEDKQQFMLRVNGEDILFAFSESGTSIDNSVYWVYKGTTKEEYSATCHVWAKQERIYGISCGGPKLYGSPTEDEFRDAALSELNVLGFVTDDSKISIHRMRNKSQENGGYFAIVDVTLSDTQKISMAMRKGNGRIGIYSFSAPLNLEAHNPYLIPDWIVK